MRRWSMRDNLNGFKMKLCELCFTPYEGDVCPTCHNNRDYADGYLDAWNASQKECELPTTLKGRGFLLHP